MTPFLDLHRRTRHTALARPLTPPRAALRPRTGLPTNRNRPACAARPRATLSPGTGLPTAAPLGTFLTERA